MIEVVVYFHGPMTDWSSKIADREIVARHKVPFRWLARLKVKAIMDGLNAGRCGYALVRDGELLEQQDAPDRDLGATEKQ